ncbi:MAG: hypothetical protein ACK5LN_04845 [Propioniciclava sp.]
MPEDPRSDSADGTDPSASPVDATDPEGVQAEAAETEDAQANADAPTDAADRVSLAAEPTSILPVPPSPEPEPDLDPVELLEDDGSWVDAGEVSRAKRRRRWTLALILALIVAGIGGYFWWDTSSKARREQAITETATNYLNAIANADAAAALETLDQAPENTTLISNEVLAASREIAPLTNPMVASVTPEGETATAAVSYSLGEEAIEVTLSLVGDGRTSWRISDGLSNLALTGTDALTVNGAEVSEPSYSVLPGTYTATPVSDLLTLGEQTTAVVTDPSDEDAILTPEYALSKKGAESVQAIVKKQFDECLAATETEPDGCPFGVNPGEAQVEPGSVRFTLENDPWKDFSALLDPAAMTASGRISFEVTITATATFEGRTGLARLVSKSNRGWTIDLTQEPLAAVWD